MLLNLIDCKVAQQAKAYLRFCSKEQLGKFLLLVHHRVTRALNLPVPIHTPDWREALRVKCLTQEHNTISPDRAQCRTV